MQILTFSVSPVNYLRYCDFPVRFCAVFAQSKNLFRNSENTAQNLTGESQYRIVYTGEKENENLHHQKEVFTYLEQRECCGTWVKIKLDLGALSRQMLMQQNKQLILFLAYRMIILRYDVCYVTVYTPCQELHICLCITEY